MVVQSTSRLLTFWTINSTLREVGAPGLPRLRASLANGVYSRFAQLVTATSYRLPMRYLNAGHHARSFISRADMQPWRQNGYQHPVARA
jgi:spermidine synthase